jgi:O6-methylguanine-DNA--protein-cysteine methyltransferase
MPCHGVIKNDGFLGNYGFGLKLESEPIKLEAKRK